MRRLPLPAVLIVQLMLVLAGCGDDGDSGGSSPETKDAKKVTQAKAQGDVTWCIGKDTTGAFRTVVDNFNKQNPNANATLLELPEYAAQGWLLDVSDSVEKNKDQFIESTLDTARYQDKYWAIPFNTNAGFVYYRTDQAKEAPASWEDMLQQAQQDDGFIFQGARYEGLTVNFLELLYSGGGNVVNDDATEATADTQEVRDVLSFMKKGIDDGAIPKAVTTYMEEESRRAFEAGRATFMRNWPYAYALGKDSQIADEFDVTTFPSYKGKEGAGVLGGYNLAISAYSENPEGALAFAEFATSADQQVPQVTEASLPSVVTSVYDRPEVKKALPFAAELRKAVEQAKPRPVSPVYPQISEAIYTNVYAALQGDKSPDQAATDMNSDIQKALETF